MYKFLALSVILLCLLSCEQDPPIYQISKDNTELNSSLTPDKIVSIGRSNNYSKIKVRELNQLQSLEYHTVKNDKIGNPYSVAIKENYSYVVSKKNFKIIKFDTAFTRKINSFGSTGRGPGEGGFISVYAISNNDIILYDSNLQKLLCFSLDGNLKYERIISNNEIPYQLSSLEHVSGDIYLATGISMKEWTKLNQNKAYHNVYLLKITSSNVQLVDSKSVIPKNIIAGIKADGIIGSNVSSPFNLAKKGKNYYLFNIYSGTVFILKISEGAIKIDKVLHPGTEIFKNHPKISQIEYQQNLRQRNRWIANGNFFINLFENSSYLFFFLSKVESEKAIYELIIIDKTDFEVIKKIIIEEYSIIRDIDNSYIHFFSFDRNIGEYVYAKVDLHDLIAKE